MSVNGPPTCARPTTTRASRSFSAGVSVVALVSRRRGVRTTLFEELLFLVAEVEEETDAYRYE